MKTSVILTVSIALLAATAPRPVQAGSRERAFAAGVIGGAVMAHAYRSAEKRHEYYTAPRTVTPCPTTTVTYRSGNGYHDGRYVSKRVHQPSGRYEVRYEKVWVPGYKEKYRDDFGRWVVRRVPGHYETRRRTVWVADTASHRPTRHSSTRVVYVR